MSAQAQLQRCRQVVPSASAPAQPPTYGAGSSDPMVTMSPIAPASGKTTTGLTFLVIADTVTACTVWKRDPGTGVWGVLAAFNNIAPQAIAPFVWLSVCDLLASEIWFQTDAAIEEDSGHAGPFIIYEETSG